MTGVHPAIDALTDFPDWYTSDWEILSAYGQSRADNRAAGTGVVTDDTREPLYPQQCIMMNNNRAPGHAFEDNFTSSSASNIIPFFDGRGVTQESSPTLQISITSPCVVTWPNHGLQDRDNVRFYDRAASDGNHSGVRCVFRPREQLDRKHISVLDHVGWKRGQHVWLAIRHADGSELRCIGPAWSVSRIHDVVANAG